MLYKKILGIWGLSPMYHLILLFPLILLTIHDNLSKHIKTNPKVENYLMVFSSSDSKNEIFNKSKFEAYSLR